jgi:riboflavin synthase
MGADVFTGIVEEVGRVVAANPTSLTIAARTVLADLRLGDSIACDGTCLTVTRLGHAQFTVGLQPETLRRTTLGQARPGRWINLERALPANGRLGGHFVQGHVDGTGRVTNTRRDGEAVVLDIAAPARIARYVVEKGFVAVDGISLTVVEAAPDGFTVSLVGYTQEHVALVDKHSGDAVNLEVDILAKYVERFVAGGPRAAGGAAEGDGEGSDEQQGGQSGLTLEFLSEHGFA